MKGIKLFCGSVFFTLFSSHPLSAKDCQHTNDTLHCIEFVSNHDGDTITVNIPNIFPPLFSHHMQVRLAEVDTPEINGKGPCEAERAQEAKEYVHTLLSKATSIEITHIAKDKYFRILGDVKVDGTSLKEGLLAKKLAVPYDGGTKQKNNWCEL